MPNTFKIRPIAVFKKSIELYIRNILRFTEIISWVVLPASILFVLFFFWGLTEDSLVILLQLFYAVVLPALTALLYIVVINAIQNFDEHKKISTLTLYAEAFSIYGSFLLVFVWYFIKINLWSVLFWIVYFINKEVKPWSVALLIPGMVASYLYGFSFIALLEDDKRGRQALAFSKELIKKNFWKSILYVVLTMILMMPLSKFVFFWAGNVYDMSLLGSLTSIMFNVCLVNLAAAVIVIFWTVCSYYSYQEFEQRNKETIQ